MVSAFVSVYQFEVTRSGSLDPGRTGRSGRQHAEGSSGTGKARHQREKRQPMQSVVVDHPGQQGHTLKGQPQQHPM
jgi:hypothetical protein